MSLNDFLLYVLLLGVIAPIVFAAQVLYLTRKDKTQKKLRQKMIHTPIAFLGAAIGLFLASLLVGDGLSYTLNKTFPYFLVVVTVFPITWLIIMYVQKYKTVAKTDDSPQY